MKRIACLVGLVLLAACGVDGPPRAPESAPAIGFSGEMRMGVVKEL